MLLALDATLDGSEAGREALARASRAPWAVAEVHLRAQDRVGLRATGSAVVRLPPTSGRRARWLLLDALLPVGGITEARLGSRLARTREVVPADALVVGITTLRSPAFTRPLVHHRRAGHTTAALVIDQGDLVPRPQTIVDTAAHRLWRAELEVERHQLARAGVPTVLVHGDEVAPPPVAALRRITGARARTRAAR